MNAGFCPACGEILEERHQGAWCRRHGKVLTCCEGPIDMPASADQGMECPQASTESSP